MIIHLENIVKMYKLGDSTVRAVDDVSFDVEKGEMAAIIGASGSGKTTLLNLIGCLDRPDEGTYLLSGENVSKLHKTRLAEIRNRYIGFIFQSFYLIPRMSALENVELPLMYAGNRKAREMAVNALERVGLGDRMHHEPNQLSGGQRQRVAVARAIVTEPAVLLADEPTGNLDSKTTVEIIGLFKELNDEGRTIVIVTHEPDVAAQCTRTIRVMDGRIIEDIRTEH